MADNVQSAMLEILKRIQSDVADVKQRLGGVETRLGDVETRLARVEDSVVKQRRDGAALLVMMRGTVGLYDERLVRFEEDIRLVKERLGL